MLWITENNLCITKVTLEDNLSFHLFLLAVVHDRTGSYWLHCFVSVQNLKNTLHFYMQLFIFASFIVATWKKISG